MSKEREKRFNYFLQPNVGYLLTSYFFFNFFLRGINNHLQGGLIALWIQPQKSFHKQLKSHEKRVFNFIRIAFDWKKQIQILKGFIEN